LINRPSYAYAADGSGALDKEELKVAMRTVGLELSEAELKQITEQVDVDGSGSFDFSEFVEVW
jgi:calmodulin